jgi:RNA polymerase sigma factor (sigma-70 family)
MNITHPTPAERRRLQAEARRDGEIAADSLDRLLLYACATPGRLSALLRSLDGVYVVSPRDADDDVLGSAPLLGTDEVMISSDDLRSYSELVRTLTRLTRQQEHTLARRLEFARARMRRLLADVALPEETRERVLERGLDCDRLRDELEGSEDVIDIDEVLEALPCGSCDPWVSHVVDLYSELRARFVERNLYLVIGMSQAYRTYGVPMMDLVQEGNAALIRAVEKYDWRKNVRFGTYAAFWVRQGVERLITANRGIVRVPNYIQQKMRRFRREGKLPRNPKDVDLKDVSELFDTDVKGATRLMETDRGWFSLDLPMSRTDDDGSYAGSLAAEEPDDDITANEKRALGQRLEEVMGETLTDTERDILVQRFGLGGRRPRTLDEIGSQLAVSRERVRQMQIKALQKLQAEGALATLADYL